jgi:Mn2+/Fe2+ NRAMP family transporter
MRPGFRGVLIGAAFLMATSAIGPGFLTQTAVFTERLGASFAFAILVSIIIDLAAQLNIWRVIAVSGRRAGEIADDVARGLGMTLAILVALGGLAFNVGNVAGAGLGLQVVFGMPVWLGAALSATVAIGLFLMKEAARAMDRFAMALGLVLVALTWYVAIASDPPVGEALRQSVMPERIDLLSIVTIVGGTVGGYITFAGAHRLVDAGVKGVEAIPQVNTSAAWAIGIASLMRIVLFLAALGIVHRGLALDPANPPASVFRHATGEVGYRVFGVVMWSAAITSVVGAAYTSVSFLRGLHRAFDAHWTRVVIAFIGISTVIFLLVGRPVRTLVLVGALNGLILPLGLATMLVAAHRARVVGATYRHPRVLTLLGAVVAAAMAAAGGYVLVRDIPTLMR